MRCSKHHGLGNDFLVVLGPLDPSSGPTLARALCDRRRGLGADGLVVGAPPAAAGADVTMHLWNADGSRAETSGNGMRCLAQGVLRGRGHAGGTVVADTDAGRRVLVVTPGPDPATVEVRVDMGPVGDGPGVRGLDGPAGLGDRLGVRQAGTADLGNPHLVLVVDDPAGVDLADVGSRLETAYPGGMNVEVIAPVGDDVLALRVWERGAGITEACGTGACAAAHLAHRWGLVGDHVRVDMPGGSARVDLTDGRAVLSGPATHVADLDVSGPVLAGEVPARA